MLDDDDDRFQRDRLHRAAAAGDLRSVKSLVADGCPVNEFDDIGKSPLHYAALGDHHEVIALLVRAGADVNLRGERWIGDTPLGEVAGTCSLRTARMLIDAGADPTVRGWMNLNALDRAKQRKERRGQRTGSDGQAVYELLLKAARKRTG